MNIPQKTNDRLIAGIKHFQPILAAAKARDSGEADTVTIVTDMLAEVFGYDKYSEATSEFSIKGTYCDMAIKLDGVVQTLIEVKPVGIDLKDQHVKQAVDYAANQGVDWVVLTNGIHWRIYSVKFTKPIEQELVVDIDFSCLNPKNEKDLGSAYLFCKEGFVKSALSEYQTQKQALSRFFLGALMLSDHVLDVVRRELRRVTPDVKIEVEEIKAVLVNEVIKREVIDGEQADAARKKIARAASKLLRKNKRESEGEELTPPPLPVMASAEDSDSSAN